MADHRALFKTQGFSISTARQLAKSNATERRTERRQAQYSKHRDLPVEEPQPVVESSAVVNQTNNAPSFSEANLTKNQKYLLKFHAWRLERMAKKQTIVKRPFTAAVPKNQFLSPQLPNIKPNHKFRPPPNLPKLVLNVFDDRKRTGTINEVIVTRSMTAAAAKQAQQKVAAQKSTVAIPKKPSVSKSAKPVSKPQNPHKNFVQPIVAAPKIERKTMKPDSRKYIQPAPKLPAPVRSVPKLVSTIPIERKPAPKGTAKPFSSSLKPPGNSKLLLAVPSNPNTNLCFVLDGSMVTSTASKPKSNKKNAPTHVDLFSPIEMPKPTKESREPPPVDLNVTPIMPVQSPPTGKSLNYVSPFVTTTRGKVSARKEREKRDSVYNLNQSASFDPVIDVETRQRRETAKYFRKQVDDETDRLMALSDQWQAYKEEYSDRILTEYLDLIDVTTGQTRLLLAKKFRQFRGLIEQCESGEGEQKVLAADLEGFWSMVYMQVEQCNARFERLDALKAIEWKEECEIEQPPFDVKVVRKPKKKTLPTSGTGIMAYLKESRAKFRRELEDRRAAAEQAAQGTPRKTPRKSMLNSVLVQEAVKSSPLRQSMAATSAIRTPRRQTTNLGSPSPSIFKKSILKTPATKRRTGRGVVFADTIEHSPTTPLFAQRKSKSPLRFKCTPMPVVDQENTTPNFQSKFKKESRSLESPSNVFQRLSLSDSPRRSTTKRVSSKKSVQ